MSTNDLQALFANLKPKPREASTVSSVDDVGRSTGTNTQFPQTSNPLPPFSSISPPPVGMDTPQTSTLPTTSAPSATAQSLLSLLNFGSSTGQHSTASPSPAQLNRTLSENAPVTNQPTHHTSMSASDLVARFMSPVPTTHAESHTPLNLEDQGGGGVDEQNQQPENPSNPQDALLKLLSRAQENGGKNLRNSPGEQLQGNSLAPELPIRNVPSGKSSPALIASSAVQSNRNESPLRFFGTSESQDAPKLEAPKQEDKPETRPIFTYTNPFEALNASRTQTPKSSTPAPQPKIENAKVDESEIVQPSVETPNQHMDMNSPTVISSRRKLTPKLPSAKFNVLSRESTAQSGTIPPQPNFGLESTPVKTGTQTPNIDDDNHPQVTHTEDISKEDHMAVEDGGNTVLPTIEGQNGATDEWEDAEDSPKHDDNPRQVPVYNFPIKPFVSITLHLESRAEVGIREDGVMEISRLKKDFDQLDRSLAAATTKFIAYALLKNGGMRIIRQDDGSDRQVFKNSYDRVFNVSFCTTATNLPHSDDQAVLGTGVSGAVYYATVSKTGNDLFEKDELESECLIFPPYPPADENTAGGVLKTRAKRSSRHPEFFAIGRGKSIHLIWPATAISPRYGVTEFGRKVDVEKFYQERSLQISTGKAGKDFVFSEDDTIIVSLDKTGRLRFWDIRNLIDEENATAPRVNPVTVDTPLLSLLTASPTEKSWPTSVLFVDKSRPYTKGGALRYILVGLRQNHTLQLWDIALGKAVQELNFPHENETDGVCSVNYHPGSGIIVVGHPTRNSIFFIHLSAPKYQMSSSVSQATYIERIASKDPDLEKLESTACMSGIREISFAEKGQLRSVELLPIHKPAEAPKTSDEKTTLFELYVVHSKGVTCLNINREDLGWNADSKVINPIDAKEKGVVSLKELKLGGIIDESARRLSPVEEVPHSSKKKKSSKKTPSGVDRTEVENEPEQSTGIAKQVEATTIVSDSPGDILGSESHAAKENKKAKKKNQVTDLSSKLKSSSRVSSPATERTHVSEKDLSQYPTESAANEIPIMEKQSDRDGTSKPEAVTVGISGDWLDKELKKVERGVSNEFRKELDNLYRNIQNDRVVQDSSAVARQEAVLRLVSTTLTNNVEKSLSRILSAQMQQIVVPAIAGATVQAVTAQVGDAMAKALHGMIPHEVATHLPVAINATLSSPHMSRTLAEAVSNKIAKQTESQVTDIIQKTIIPTFENVAISAAENAASAVEARLRAEMHQHEVDRRRDTARIEKLSQVLQGMAETLQTMSDTQVSFQGQILKDRRQLALMGESSSINTSRQVSTARMSPAPTPNPQTVLMQRKSKEEIELEEITKLMNEGKYEEGSIKWLQSSQPIELFDNLFVRFTPEYLSTDVSPLVAFSIAVTVANSLITNTTRRLEWISAAFDAVDLSDPEIADLSEHAPSLLASLIQKLESLYMTIAEHNPNDSSLKIIPTVAKKAKEMRSILTGHGGPARPTPGFEFR